MKKILLLGGSYFQVPSVITAKKMGYYTITCDYLPDNPGHRYADEYHNISTTDKEAVLHLAKKLKVDGILCYASDPAAPTAAYVCEKMGFPTSPYESVEILSNKDKFRSFLKQHQFCVPNAKGYSDITEALAEISSFHFPVMVKPVDSSGSKGVSKIDRKDDLPEAAKAALSYSRCKRFIIEEYVDKDGYQIAGDGFSVNGVLQFRCFANDHFDSSGINPYVLVGESWPCKAPVVAQDKLHDEIQRALKLLNMKTGAYNLEARIGLNGKIYIMEIGPRNGGNLIPQVIKYATGIDLVEYSIMAAMGESCSDLKMAESGGFWSSYMIHSRKAGILKKVDIDEQFQKTNIVEFEMFYKAGDSVEAFTGSNGTLGTMVLKYSSEEEMLEKMDHMEEWVKVVVE